MAFNNYFDVDEILSGDERLSVKFHEEAVRLGFLDSSSLTENLQKGARVDLPLWLASALQRNGSVAPRIPTYLTAAARTHMKANATGADLRAASPYYYEVSQAVAEMMPGKERDIVEPLLQILTERYFTILDNAQSAREEDVSEYVQKLTVLETSLYHVAAEGAREISKWKRLETDKIERAAKRSKMW